MSAGMDSAVGAETANTRAVTEQLAPRDAVFYYDETDRHPSSIVAVYVFDSRGAEPLDTAAAVCWAQERTGLAPLFRRRLRRVPFDLDLPYWVPDQAFDIAEHVLVEPAGADWDTVRRRLGEISAARVDLGRPPWKFHFFDRVHGVPGAPGPTTIAVLTFHHSAGDGVATRELEAELFSGRTASAAPGDAPWRAPVVGLRAALRFPYRLVCFAIGLRRAAAARAEVRARAAAGLLDEPLPFRPATRFNRAAGPGRTVDQVTLALSEVKAACARCLERTTVNDMMLTVVSGALATYLGEKGETPPESLAAMVPISMRGIAEWDSANRLGQMAVDLHTGVTDPLARLAAIRESVRRERRRTIDPAVLRYGARVETSPAWLLRLAGWARAQRSFAGAESIPLSNTTISNVPPTGDGLTFRGAPLLRAFGVLPVLDGDGLRHLVSSQGDELVITFQVDSAMMPDPERYRELLVQAFRDLVDALG
ncbi:wax ester/triacylglycerol synthase family O-acyltransferase [Nocardia carnea]|uniref:wax ester/triacylglycerol synthase family O-acyltransferase n=1 Tax=Nocardia carnea TaxID=37328 RepID=UPI0024589CDF|nr:wax ester/triacylglycerol synthase family O-acyltransferase [Nocardia carnea]